MTSAIKREANRRNSLQSTGPRTPEGKRISSQNATKLGIFSRELLLNEESEAELQVLARAVRADLQPRGPIESSLVDLIISVLWRLRRLLRIEAGIFEMYKVYKGRDGGAPVAFAHDASQLDCFSRLGRAEATLERRLYKALSELARLQTSRLRPDSETIDIEATATPQAAEQPLKGWRRWLA